MEQKKTFGEYIQQKRKEANLTQRGFAEKLYVTESAVSKWERGLSYPDISLIRDICTVLQITEHELLTASEDTQTRNNERLALKYLRMIRKFKWAQFILYGTPLLICFICNLAIQHTLSWFFIVFASLATVASLTLLPIMLERHRGPLTLAGFTFCLLMLLLICNIYTGGAWFIIAAISIIFGLCVVFSPMLVRDIVLPNALSCHKAFICMAADTILLLLLLMICEWFSSNSWLFSTGLPIAGFSLIYPWGMLLIIRYAKVNGFFKSAACLGLSGAMLYLTNGVIAAIVGDITYLGFGHGFDLSKWTAKTTDANINVLILGLLFGLAVIFTVAGIIAELRKKGQ